MILGADKTRLSKRHGATSVMAYKEMGYLPEALVNYLVRLGWSYGDQEIFTVDELIRHFSFEHVGKSAAVFNPNSSGLTASTLCIHRRKTFRPCVLLLLQEKFCGRRARRDAFKSCRNAAGKSKDPGGARPIPEILHEKM
jgi:hypothetical protein